MAEPPRFCAQVVGDLVRSGVFVRIAADPVDQVVTKVHAAVLLERVAKSGDHPLGEGDRQEERPFQQFLKGRGAMDIGPLDHAPSRARPMGIVDGQDQGSPLPNEGGRGVDGFPHGAGVVQGTPGVDDVEQAVSVRRTGPESFLREWIQDGTLHQRAIDFRTCHGGALAQGLPALGVDVGSGHDCAQAMRVDQAEALTEADIEKGFALEIDAMEQAMEGLGGFVEPLRGEGFSGKADPVFAEIELLAVCRWGGGHVWAWER